MIEMGIDEVTVILFPNEKINKDNYLHWDDIASKAIFELEEKLNLLPLLGERKMLNKAFLGYSMGYTYGNHDFFFCVCYHHLWNKMGILVKFSAQAFAYYQEQTNLLPYQILQKMQSELYTVRCSRIDIAVDYINKGIDINEIYNSYSNEELFIFVLREKNMRIEKAKKTYPFRGVFHNSDCETIYYGERTSPVMLRIYNKKVEQITKKGVRYQDAKRYDDWVRFELEIKNYYAHDLTEALLNIKNEIEYKELLIDFFIQKFYFVNYYKDEYYIAPYTKDLADIKNDKRIILFKSLDTKNTELANSLIHLFKNSGTVTSLYKIGAIWKIEGLNQFLKELKEYVYRSKPNPLCERFLRNNIEEYRTLYPDFASFFQTEVKPEIEDNA